MASNSRTPDDVVEGLAADLVDAVRLEAAASALYRPAIHDALSRSPDLWVRAVLTDVYAATPGRALDYVIQARLAEDPSSEVRGRVAHRTAYLDLFESLLEDSDAKVRAFCAANPRATREHIERLIRDRQWAVRAAAAANGVRFPDDEQLVRLAVSPRVRWRPAYVAPASMRTAGEPAFSL